MGEGGDLLWLYNIWEWKSLGLNVIHDPWVSDLITFLFISRLPTRIKFVQTYLILI